MAMDQQRNLRLRSAEELRVLFGKNGVTPDREVIVYCHTHHRSAHTYMVLKSLGYEQLKGYAGSWSDWGNRQDTPVETG
jgi:thiosulfate/3-mercaptopyruvate sulfurtransferase